MQFELMNRLVSAGLDVYGYTTFTSDRDERLASRMSDFMDRLQGEVHPLFPLRTVPLRIVAYTPTRSRMSTRHQRALEIQWDAAEAWTEELYKRFPEELRAKPIFAHKLVTR